LERLIIIPARKGSKGLPNKNKLLLGGIPLIQWSIDHALREFPECHLVVSTDDLEIIDLCKIRNVNYIQRSDALSSDSSMMIDVLSDALSFYEKVTGISFELVILLQPTYPFRTREDALRLKELLVDSDFDNIISVVRVSDAHPARMYKIIDNNLHNLNDEYSFLNRQDLPPVYLRNGAYYTFRSRMIRDGVLYGRLLVPYLMGGENKVNIDDPLDYLLAKLIYEESIKS